MNKIGLKAIVTLMSLVLVGLVSVQIYWIKSAITLKEQQFDQTVNEALGTVAEKLEKRDAMNMLMNEVLTDDFYNHPFEQKVRLIQSRLNMNFFDENLDMLFGEMEREMEGMKQAAWSDKSLPFPQVNFRYDTIITIDSSEKGIFQSSIRIQVNDSVQDICVSSSSKERLRRSVDENVQKIRKRQNLVNDMMFRFFSDNKSFHERIGHKDLELMVCNSLQDKGVDIPFEYAVVNPYGTLISESPEFDPSGVVPFYQTGLFANDIFSEPNRLLVQFPDKRNYILKSLGVMSLSSIGLILIISFCFAYAIHVIVQQKKLSEMKTDFINNMTHEFKTPVATISLASEMLKDEKVISDKERMKKYAGVIFDENKRLGSQVEKVLQMAALDKSDFNLKISNVNAHELIEKVKDKLALQVESRNGMIHLSLNAKDPLIEADEYHLTNIIFNLLDNAIKYSKDAPDVTVSSKDSKDGILIVVADKGIGMSKEDHKRIFEKFYRVSTGNLHDVKGFGLGLSYVKAMMEAHSGDISVKSEPGKGSTFELFFPYKNI